MYSLENRDDLEYLIGLISLQNQTEELCLQNKLGRRNFNGNLKKVFEQITDTIKNTSEYLTKTMMLTSKENNNALENLKVKHIEMMTDRGILSFFPLYLLFKTV